jgi:hypothetical protein
MNIESFKFKIILNVHTWKRYGNNWWNNLFTWMSEFLSFLFHFIFRAVSLSLHFSQHFLNFLGLFYDARSCNSSVGIAIGYGLAAGVRFPAGTRDFSLLHSVQTDSEAIQSPIRCVPVAFSHEVKRPRREADHSPPSSAEIKKCWIIPPLPHASLWPGA